MTFRQVRDLRSAGPPECHRFHVTGYDRGKCEVCTLRIEWVRRQARRSADAFEATASGYRFPETVSLTDLLAEPEEGHPYLGTGSGPRTDGWC